MSTLAGPFHPLNKQPSRKNLTRDQWRLCRGGIKHVCLSSATESIEMKLEVTAASLIRKYNLDLSNRFRFVYKYKKRRFYVFLIQRKQEDSSFQLAD